MALDEHLHAGSTLFLPINVCCIEW
jgi:hypothetical protein